MVTKVLFLCIHNSARSQMAEAYLKKFGGDKFFVESAGLEPGVLNPLAIEAMRLDGIDISQNKTNDVFDFYRQGNIYEFVITVCDAKAAEKCPIFPGLVKMLHWSFEDPSALNDTHDKMIEKTIEIRDKIKSSVLDFVNEFDKNYK